MEGENTPIAISYEGSVWHVAIVGVLGNKKVISNSDTTELACHPSGKTGERGCKLTTPLDPPGQLCSGTTGLPLVVSESSGGGVRLASFLLLERPIRELRLASFLNFIMVW